MRRTPHAGFTLIETMLAVLAGTALAAIAVALALGTGRATRAAATATAILDIAEAIHMTHPRADYAGLTPARIAGNLPRTYLNAAGTDLVVPLATPVQIAATTTGMASAFTITLHSVPADACVRILGTVHQQFRQVRAGAPGSETVLRNDPPGAPVVVWSDTRTANACARAQNTIILTAN